MGSEHGETVPRAVVGIGASAGGLHALEDFFGPMPAETDVAFVVVTHQAHEDHSMLPELLARVTELPVAEVAGPTELEPGHVYVQVGGREIGFEEGSLVITNVDSPRRAVIDRFFRNLSAAYADRAICVILSGGGSDGSVGAEAIKAAAGMVMAQTPDDAEHPDMPTNVLEAGVVDFSAPAHELGALLLDYVDRPLYRGDESVDLDSEDQETLERMFQILSAGTGTDFGVYKQTTLQRRVERRMNVRNVTSLASYIELLDDEPDEVQALFHEILIGVTSFFRDEESWEVLAEKAIIPMLEEGDRDRIRAWVPGCSTGEEAYSLAILLKECAEELDRTIDIQVFATDVNPAAIDVARGAIYPAGVEADLSPERLSRFFLAEESGYRVAGPIRELVVFATQNVLVDPPFSDIDIISCRNVLIYFQHEPRRRLLPLFHYALSWTGVLFLGPSESLGDAERYFDVIDKPSRIFRRREVPPDGRLAELGLFAQRRASNRPTPALTTATTVSRAERVLLDQLTPPSVICSVDGKVLHIHGRTGKYLEPSPGTQRSVSILNMARKGLRFELSSLLREAWERRPALLHRQSVPVLTNGDWTLVDLVARGVERPGERAGQVIVGFVPPPPRPDQDDGSEDEEDRRNRVAALEAQVKRIGGKRQVAVEELEVANEEFRSMNEELQSTNEELQSSNEELKTSKEEVQSLNEELRTVNEELEPKVRMLSAAHDDMSNLLNGTSIATFFLDNDLNIKRFTQSAKSLVNVIPSDVGRNIADLVMQVDAGLLIETAREVADTLQTRELELEHENEDGRWYLTRIVPYRTDDNVITGLVITFVEITKRKKIEAEYHRLTETLAEASAAIAFLGSDRRCQEVVGRPFGRDPDEWAGERTEDRLEGEAADAARNQEELVLDDRSPRQSWIRTDEGWTVRHIAPATGGDDGAEALRVTSMTVNHLPGDGQTT